VNTGVRNDFQVPEYGSNFLLDTIKNPFWIPIPISWMGGKEAPEGGAVFDGNGKTLTGLKSNLT
jgi:hypothetical protein